jgi:hypothetical protein
MQQVRMTVGAYAITFEQNNNEILAIDVVEEILEAKACQSKTRVKVTIRGQGSHFIFNYRR